MLVLLLVSGLLGVAFAVPRESRIVGGEETTIEQHPFMASMLRHEEEGVWRQYCGGTLLTANAVVSASHCVINRAAASVRLRLGSTYSNFGGVVHIVSRIVMHPEFNMTVMINDVAVLKLRERAVYSQKINSSRIAGPRYVLYNNNTVSVIGWGRLQSEGNKTEILRHVDVKVIDQQTCYERYEYLKNETQGDYLSVTDEMFCTGFLDVGGKGSCQGDSGGPLMRSGDVLVGIVSWAFDCADAYYPSVNVRVSNYTNWIVSNLN